MKTIWLNGRKMTSIPTTHYYLKRKLGLPAYYGNNLDALWDVLSTSSEPVQVMLLFRSQMVQNLGRYGDALVQVFLEAAKVNPNFMFSEGIDGSGTVIGT